MLPRNSNPSRVSTTLKPSRFAAFALALSLLVIPLEQAAADRDDDDAPLYVPPTQSNYRTPGAIFAVGQYRPLVGGDRAGAVGDLLTIVLTENMQASKSASSQTGKNGGFGFSLPSTGWFSLFSPSDTQFSGGSDFKGKGVAAQSNNLFGEMTVVVTEVYPNGVMRVRGQKAITLNRGDEFVELSGLVRASDVSEDNRVASTRVADADIKYYGKGEIAEASRKGWLSRFFSIINPF